MGSQMGNFWMANNCGVFDGLPGHQALPTPNEIKAIMSTKFRSFKLDVFRQLPLKSHVHTSPLVKVGHLILGADLKEKFNAYVEVTSDERPERRDIKLHLGIYYHCDDVWNPKVGDIRIQFYYAGLSGEPVTSRFPTNTFPMEKFVGDDRGYAKGRPTPALHNQQGTRDPLAERGRAERSADVQPGTIRRLLRDLEDEGNRNFCAFRLVRLPFATPENIS